MIAASIDWTGAPWLDASRMAPSLGLFAGHPAATWHDGAGRRHAACLVTPRGRQPVGWAPQLGPQGEIVLVEGQIDNCADLAVMLGLPETAPQALVFAHAAKRWGDAADARCIGDYAAIVLDKDGALRLSRSPWAAPSLFFVNDGRAAAVCSIPRALFAAGWPRRLMQGQLADALFWIENAGDAHWYEGIRRVAYGTIVHIAPGGAERRHEWYDPLALPDVRRTRDEDYVGEADALLSEAVKAALRPARRPGILLSGGLDSAIVADEILRHRPPGDRLPSYTFVPLAAHAGVAPPGSYDDDRARVEAFAAMHPRLEAHYCDNDGIDFDGFAAQFFAATDAGRPAMAINAAYHGPLAAAARDGCDWVFDAAMGNNGFSNDGRWAYLEFARTGKWGELVRLARDHPGDERPLWRRLIARTLVPRLPGPVRAALRTAVHGRTPDLMPDLTLLRPKAIARYDLVTRAKAAGTYRTGEWFTTREEWLRFAWRMHDMGAEWRHGVEQVFGIRHRDVSAYRPLLEYCAGLPTDQFVRGGVQRWLARRMASGRMPEAQRLGTAYGRHNVDWHLRLSHRLPEMRREFERMADDPELGELIDTDRALAMLDRWPAETPSAPQEVLRHFAALTGAVLVARFQRFESGANG
ncbi:asparagine synthase-related protein [Qipengyuania sp.]|uniref:asparagine synthase-related protein n=1 Tax=Qipengyuania sp. TaxID=2004515 RepID=UPI0037352414